MKRYLVIMASAAALAVAPLQASAGVGGRPPEGEALGAIPPELIGLAGLGVIGGVTCAVACGGGGNPTPTTTTSTTAATVSDRRLKTDIARIGETRDGYPLYRFSYVWEPAGVFHIGVMAQDLPADLVTTLPNGVMVVDHSRIDF